MTDGTPTSVGRQYRVLGLLALAELPAMTLWFGVSAVGPVLGNDADVSGERPSRTAFGDCRLWARFV